MAEKWKTQDSARTMTQKYNALVEEVNNNSLTKASTENTSISIENDLTDEDFDEILGNTDKEV